jgi:formylglycine-generating enzyme required for sulfatase activity
VTKQLKKTVKIKHLLARSLWLLALATFNLQLTTAHAQGRAFTYQGRLNSSGSPASGSYDFRFRLAADPLGNTYVGSAYLTNGIAVASGLFTTTIDFGPGLFAGTNYWLEVDVRTNGAANYTALTPLQAFTPTPYAIFANTASNVSGTVSAAQISGAVASANLSGTYGNALTLNNAGNAFNGTFTGSGANLTALNANNLASGTVPLAQLSGITGSQLAAATWQLATNLNGGNAALASNVVSGISITNATISGNGGGLTNVTAATLAIPQGMALIPAGTFSMGDSLDGESDAMPTTNITVSAFYMDINLVSYAQWQSVFFWATNHGYGFVDAGAGKAANHPVQTVDWYDSVKWSNARSQQAGLTPVYYTDAGLTQVYTNGEVTPYMKLAANGYRLPTEAEWEKAARGGLNGQRFPWGNVITENLANYYGATASYSYDLGPNGYNTAFTNGVTPYTSPVGYFAPNGYGLYDMADDVTEWCWDWYGTPYGQPTNTNPTGPVTGSYRVLRGGYWGDVASGSRCACRDYYLPLNAVNDVGFRCVRGH